jgi:hypothetical protein
VGFRDDFRDAGFRDDFRDAGFRDDFRDAGFRDDFRRRAAGSFANAAAIAPVLLLRRP